MPRKSLIDDEHIIRNAVKTFNSIPGARIEFMVQKVGGPFAGAFRLSGPWGDYYYYLKVVPKLSPTVTDLVIHQIRTSPTPENAHPLLVSHYISPGLAEKLKEADIEYLDCAGNMLIRQLPLYLHVGGQKHAPKPPGTDRLFRTAGLKLVYLLLRNRQSVSATYRMLADDAGIALGAVGSLFKELEKRGNLAPDDQGNRQLSHIEELLQRWQLGYVETLRPRLYLQRCRQTAGFRIDQLPDQLRQLNYGRQVLIGGELGAALLTSGFSPASAILYMAPDIQLKTMLQLHLTPDDNGNVTLLQPFGRQCHWSGWQPEGLTLADPLLTFAELKGGATDKVAEKLYRQYLLPRIDS